jgi:uncharacterized protein (DUF2267 family)
MDRASEEVLAEIGASGALPPGLTETEGFTAVVCTLSGRLTRGEATHLVATLPPQLRLLIEPCLADRGEEGEMLHREQLIRRIAGRLGVTPEEAEVVARVVFTAVERNLPTKEILDVASQLPADLRALWIENAVVAERVPAP